MNDISIEKKLKLIHQVRSRYDQDQNDMLRREQLLYGEEDEDKARLSPFGLRLILAVAAFMLILGLDRNHKSLFGITSDQIFRSISRDYLAETEAPAEPADGSLEPSDSSPEPSDGFWESTDGALEER